MSYLTDSFVSDETKSLAESHGYIITVEPTEGAMKPRSSGFCDTTSTLVTGSRSGLGDESIQQRGRCIEEEVALYAKDKGLDIKDMLWRTVYKYEHGNIALSLNPYNDRFDSGILGFIFESKSALRAEFGVKRISSKLEETIVKRLTSELKMLEFWANNEVYDITIWDEDIIVAEANHAYGSDDVGVLSAELLAEAIFYADADA